MGIDSRGPAPRLRRPHLRRLAAPDRARRFRCRHRHAAARAPVPVHGRLGADPFRRAARARLAAQAARRPPDPDRRRRRRRRAPPPWSRSRRRPDRAATAKAAPGLYSVALEPRYRFENFVVGKANEVAFNAAQTLAIGRQGRLQPALPPWRHRARQDPPAARHRPRIPPPAAAGEDHLHVGREVHGRVRRGAARQRDDPVQAAAALGRPADDRRRPVHRRQGIDPGRILPHDERDHLGRPAARDQLRPRAAGSGRDRAAHPLAPVLGPGRRHQRRRPRAPAQHHHQEARAAARASRCPRTW